MIMKRSGASVSPYKAPALISKNISVSVSDILYFHAASLWLIQYQLGNHRQKESFPFCPCEQNALKKST